MKTPQLRILVIAASLALGGAAHAQFAALSGLGKGSPASNSGGDISADVESFVGQSATLQELSAFALQKVNAAFKTDEEIQGKRAEREAIERMTDPKEKESRLSAMIKSEGAEFDNLSKSADLESRVKTLSADKKRWIADALLNLGIAGLRAPALSTTGQSILQKAGASPANLSKISPVKNALPQLAKFVEYSAAAAGGFAKVLKGADISVQVAKADSKPSTGTF